MKKTTRVSSQEILSLKRFIVVAGAVLLSMQVTYADVIYRETFSNTAGAPNTNFDFVGWSGYWSPTAQPDDGVAIPYNNYGVGSSLGNPSGVTNVNAGPEVGDTNGFAFTSGFLAASNNILTYTTEYVVNPSAWNVGSISFYSGNASNNPHSFLNGNIDGYRIAVQIDGSWYASATNLVQSNVIGSAGAFATSGQQLVFNWTTAASAWDTLNFVPGSTLSLGGPVGSALPSDPITAFGLYSDTVTDTNGVGGLATRRWDTYEIDGTVPEPSSFVLAFIGFGTLLGLRRSRKA